jgi:uncharacterized membrane protein
MMPPGGMAPPGAIQPGAGPVWTPMEAFGFAWKLVTKRFGAVAVPIFVAWLVLVLLELLVYGALIFGPQLLQQQGIIDGVAALAVVSVGSLVAVVLILAIQGYLAPGILTLALKAVRGQPTAVGDVFSGGRLTMTFFVGLLVQSILFAVALLLCVVPAFILGCGIWAWGFLVIDQNMGSVDAMKRSWEMMKGHKMSMFIWGLLAIVVYVAGELACLLPLLLISMPMILISLSWIYLRLKGEHVPEPT